MTRTLTGQPPWLFPGVVPGRPLSRKAFNDRLARQGIHTRAARTAALIALATELPAPVLADLLDIHIHTALRPATRPGGVSGGPSRRLRASISSTLGKN
ncbi:hypothetical protein [Kitasatospora sp. GAS204B]|uniref:hypothetical protein n=1 Tax=unclassified Kitasatospora TaxID=2633591 RepID=UPI002474497A|nr:hypothetical protein [Kitasatospora sp. GAS204B]MDH6120448.1 hypothetical protein [Kitasatospora sp. GAS204B]